MPLSEDEQRILQDIERSFYETDPKFAETVSRTTLYRHAGRNCKWAVALFAVSLVVLLASFINFPLVAFAGFLGMMAATAVFVKNVRRIGNAGFKEVSEQLAAQEMSVRVDGLRHRFFDRFRRGS
jgi:hypothetical protein